MLNQETKRKIDSCRDILVGKLPDPKAQIEQITNALIYKFMSDMDKLSVDMGGNASFFVGDFAQYAWDKLMSPKLGGSERLSLYSDALGKLSLNPHLPQLFRDIFKDAFLPYRDAETLNMLLKEINWFTYTHSEDLGDAFEYLLSVMGSQGDAGQFRTPRHIIDFIVESVDPKKDETILDPACGTAGFLISSYKHILQGNTAEKSGDKLTPEEKTDLMKQFTGYDISPDMVRFSLVNMYLHGFPEPHIFEYDTLSDEKNWKDSFDVIMANPPFMSPKGGIRPHKRFSIQANRSEVLFVDYIAEHLNAGGRAGVIVPEGIIFQSGTAYKALRKMLVDNYLFSVVSLPAGVFNPYSGVKTSILLMDKTLAKQTDKILFVKIENDGLGLGAQRKSVQGNELPQSLIDIKTYVQSVRNGKEGDFKGTANCLLVPKKQLAETGDYNLSMERYRSADISSIKWPMVEISDVSTTSSGGTPLRENTAYYEGGKIPWIRSGEVAQGEVFHSELFITIEGLKNSSAKIFPINTVLVAMYGATAGEIGILRVEAATNQAVCGITPDERLIPDFLFWVLKFNKPALIRLAGGGAQPNISQKIIREFKIPLPPISIQQEIVSEIESYQKIIDGARQVVENYKPQIKIDPEWPVVALGEICQKIQYGLSVPLSTETLGYKTFRMNEIVEGICVDRGDMKCAEISSVEFLKYKLVRGDILFNRTNSFEHVGRTGIFTLDGNYCFASYLIRLTIETEKANPFYINKFMNSLGFQHGIKQFATRAIGQSNINAKSLASYHIPLPPLNQQQEIVSQIEKEKRLVDAIKELIQIYEQKIKDKIGEVWET